MRQPKKKTRKRKADGYPKAESKAKTLERRKIILAVAESFRSVLASMERSFEARAEMIVQQVKRVREEVFEKARQQDDARLGDRIDGAIAEIESNRIRLLDLLSRTDDAVIELRHQVDELKKRFEYVAYPAKILRGPNGPEAFVLPRVFPGVAGGGAEPPLSLRPHTPYEYKYEHDPGGGASGVAICSS